MGSEATLGTVCTDRAAFLYQPKPFWGSLDLAWLLFTPQDRAICNDMPYLVTLITLPIGLLRTLGANRTRGRRGYRLALKVRPAKNGLYVSTNSSANMAACDRDVTFCSFKYTTRCSGKLFLNSSNRGNSLRVTQSVALLTVHQRSERDSFSLANSTNDRFCAFRWFLNFCR